MPSDFLLVDHAGATYALSVGQIVFAKFYVVKNVDGEMQYADILLTAGNELRLWGESAEFVRDALNQREWIPGEAEG